jgi:polyisoprenoid-binding protein YceI
MMKFFALIGLFTTVFFMAKWKYIPKDAKVKFTVYEKSGVEEGVFTGLEGDVNFDEKELKNAFIKASIDVVTVNSGDEMRDASLRSADFFEVKKYPKIEFISTEIIKNDSGYCAKGNLKAKAVVKPIEIPFTFTKTSDSTALFKGSFIINRYDYKIGAKGDGVGSKVKIDLEIPVKQ